MGLCASKKAVDKVADPFDNPRRKEDEDEINNLPSSPITNILKDLRLEFTRGTTIGKRILETLSDTNRTMGLTNTELCFRLIDKNEDGILERSEVVHIVKWFLAAAIHHPIAAQYLKGIDITSAEADEAVKLISDDLFQHAGDMITDSGQHIRAITFVGFRSWLTNFMLSMIQINNEHPHDEYGRPKLEFDSIALPVDTTMNTTTTMNQSTASTTSTASSESPEPNRPTSSTTTNMNYHQQQNDTVPNESNPEPVNIATTSEEIIPNPLPTDETGHSEKDDTNEEGVNEPIHRDDRTPVLLDTEEEVEEDTHKKEETSPITPSTTELIPSEA